MPTRSCMSKSRKTHSLQSSRSNSVTSKKKQASQEGADVPPLDKLPTNEFIEKFLENNETTEEGEFTSQLTHPTSIKKAVPRFQPLPEEADEVETVLDIQESTREFDDTGQKAYENACKHYRALPCKSFKHRLQDSTHINLRHYNLGPRETMALCIPLVINNKVTSVNLSANDFGNGGISFLGKMMVENESITELNLAENNLRTKGAKVIAQILRRNHTLKILDISKNHFSDSDAQLLTKAIEEHPTLSVVNLSENGFGEQSAPLFRSMISENGHLYELNLSWNQFRNKGAVEVATGVRDNIGLKVLNLSWNGFGDKGAVAMATALKTCTLVNLDLTCNRIGAEGFISMVKALKDNDLLKHLDLSKNPIPEEAASAGLEFVFTKLDDLRLEELALGDILYSPAFGQQVKDLQEKFTNFSCHFGYLDLYGKRRMKEYDIVEEAMMSIRKYCDEHNVKIVDLFAKFDADGSMSVSHEEFKIGLREAKVPLTDEQIRELIKTLDQDNDGEIDFSEMVMGAELYK